jgi:hypothetical protein
MYSEANMATYEEIVVVRMAYVLINYCMLGNKSGLGDMHTNKKIK